MLWIEFVRSQLYYNDRAIYYFQLFETILSVNFIAYEDSTELIKQFYKGISKGKQIPVNGAGQLLKIDYKKTFRYEEEITDEIIA